MLSGRATTTALLYFAANPFNISRSRFHNTIAVPVVRAMATSTTTSGAPATRDGKVNLLDLAAAAVACTVSASRSILKIAEADQKNTRVKTDGSFVTDADFAAQGVIVQAIRTVSKDVRIVGEESEEEMARHIGQHEFLDDDIYQLTRKELRIRRYDTQQQQLDRVLPLSHTWTARNAITETVSYTIPDENDDSDSDNSVFVDPARVSIIVDPLDATKSYTRGDHDCVSILIGIILDDTDPCFGVIGKPFGYTGLTSMLDTGCVCIYGGSLIKGVYVAGHGMAVQPSKIDHDTIATTALADLPRAVISSSRSKGVVHDFCVHLGEKGLVAPEPMHISGAGEKSLRLILQRNNEALWFFPKAGTSLWDVAAPDALLRALGGRMTDKYGKNMDYSKPREEAENIDGVVACIDEKLHSECVRLFQQGDWGDRS